MADLVMANLPLMSLPDDDIYGPVQRAQQFKQQQNALIQQQQQVARQAQLRNYLAQSIDPATGRTNYNQLYGAAPVEFRPDIQGLQNADLLAQAELGSKQATGRMNEQTATATRLKNIRDLVVPVNDQASWDKVRPIIAGMDPSYAALLPQQFTPEAKNQFVMSADEFLKNTLMTAEQRSTAAGQAATREETRRHNRAMEAADAATEQRLGQEAAPGYVAPPKLKPGERWSADTQTVEAVPGSSEYIKQSKLHGKDYSSVTGIQESRRLADKKIDYLLSPENEDAFNNLFGGYNAAISSRFPGKTAAARTELNSLKSNIKNAGLRLIQQGGKIGAITEREWPILEGMISELDSSMDEESARAKLAEIKSFFARTEANALDEYETTWGNTQYYKKPKTDNNVPAAKDTWKDL